MKINNCGSLAASLDILFFFFVACASTLSVLCLALSPHATREESSLNEEPEPAPAVVRGWLLLCDGVIGHVRSVHGHVPHGVVHHGVVHHGVVHHLLTEQPAPAVVRGGWLLLRDGVVGHVRSVHGHVPHGVVHGHVHHGVVHRLVHVQQPAPAVVRGWLLDGIIGHVRPGHGHVHHGVVHGHVHRGIVHHRLLAGVGPAGKDHEDRHGHCHKKPLHHRHRLLSLSLFLSQCGTRPSLFSSRSHSLPCPCSPCSSIPH